jgi:hypothetical protein
MSYSAADAYASAPSPASPTRPAPVQQPRYSTSSGARAFDAGDYEARAGTASRSSMAKHAGGPAQAWREESESEGECEGEAWWGEMCMRAEDMRQRRSGARLREEAWARGMLCGRALPAAPYHGYQLGHRRTA